MKNTLLLLLFVFAGYGVQAQELIGKSQARQPSSHLSKYEEDFAVAVNKDFGRVTFQRNDPKLDDRLEKKIKNFLLNPPSGYSVSQGAITVRVVKKDNQYYIAQGTGFSERIFKLE